MSQTGRYYNLSTDILMGGDNPSKTTAVSQSAINRCANYIQTDITHTIETPPNYFYITNTSGGTILFYIKTNQENVISRELEFSFDKHSWFPFVVNNMSGTEFRLRDRDTIYFRGNSGTLSTGDNSYIYVYGDGFHEVGGDITTLLSYNGNVNSLPAYCFYRFFCGDNYLGDIANLSLSSMVMGDYCYAEMFRACDHLTRTPNLSATTLAQYCYSGMFRECVDLIDVYALPAATLANYCYQYMFYGCTSLVTPPTISATTLAPYCCYSMFQGCTALTTTPLISVSEAKERCYTNMFYDCTSLTTISALPATTLVQYCYYNMFYGCTSLTTAPVLPATSLATNCYQEMFRECTALTTAPVLPATNLASYCYYLMFYNCTALTTAPELPATTLASQCYSQMFYYCRNLNYIKVGATSWNTSNANQWVYNVAASGTFEKPTGVSITTGANGIPSGWTVQEYTPTPIPPQYNPSLIIHNTSGESNDISILRQGSPTAVTINYSADGTNYTSFTTSSNLTVTLSAGDSLYIDGILKSSSTSAYYHITGTKAHTVEGNLTATQNYHYNYLFYNDTMLTDASQLVFKINSTGYSYCYQYMFSGCTNLVTPPQALSTTVSDNCYTYMFNGCSSLTTSPILPATSLVSNCYKYMFNGCTELVNPPVLPATTLAAYCYQYMFNGCTRLTTAPELPAMILYDSCYQYMFSGCIRLTNVPLLPATILLQNCYANMFNGCTSLNVAPELPATTLAQNCYAYMFNGCTSLNVAPDLPATTLASGCYQYMFQGCTNLTTTPDLPATTLAYQCYMYMFNGCTSLINVPSILPATTLAENCYYYMFYGCTLLTTTPELPASPSISGCYNNMFRNCTALNYIKVSAASWNTSYTSSWVQGVAASGTFEKPTGTNIPTGYNGIPSGWTVINN